MQLRECVDIGISERPIGDGQDVEVAAILAPITERDRTSQVNALHRAGEPRRQQVEIAVNRSLGRGGQRLAHRPDATSATQAGPGRANKLPQTRRAVTPRRVRAS